MESMHQNLNFGEIGIITTIGIGVCREGWPLLNVVRGMDGTADGSWSAPQGVGI